MLPSTARVVYVRAAFPAPNAIPIKKRNEKCFAFRRPLRANVLLLLKYSEENVNTRNLCVNLYEIVQFAAINFLYQSRSLMISILNVINRAAESIPSFSSEARVRFCRTQRNSFWFDDADVRFFRWNKEISTALSKHIGPCFGLFGPVFGPWQFSPPLQCEIFSGCKFDAHLHWIVSALTFDDYSSQ